VITNAFSVAFSSQWLNDYLVNLIGTDEWSRMFGAKLALVIVFEVCFPLLMIQSKQFNPHLTKISSMWYSG